MFSQVGLKILKLTSAARGYIFCCPGEGGGGYGLAYMENTRLLEKKIERREKRRKENNEFLNGKEELIREGVMIELQRMFILVNCRTLPRYGPDIWPWPPWCPTLPSSFSTASSVTSKQFSCLSGFFLRRSSFYELLCPSINR